MAPSDAVRVPSAGSIARSRHGFTLVELLVAMAVVGGLIALLLPAVGAARAAARRSECLNHLRQLGVGLHRYHGVYRSFPPGGVEWRPRADDSKRQLAWSAFLLPFIEETEVYDQLDLGTSFDSEANAAAAATILPIYVCPSRLGPVERIDGRGPSDYGGIYGERITGRNEPPKGMMLYDRAVRIAEVEDGTSHTLIVSEDTLWSDGQWINGRNVFDQAYAINGAPPFENDIRSLHPGGAQGLLVDGSARFLSETIDLGTLAGLCTRAGGEVVGRF